MIVIDLETSGIDPTQHGILSLGAVDYDTGETFYGECRLGSHQTFTEEALRINGFTVEQIADRTKQSSVQLYQKFLKWCEGRKKLLGGHNVGSFDLQFLLKVHSKQRKIKSFPFHYRTIDLHSIAYCKYKESLSLSKICQYLGIEPEPKIHNALTGASKTCECLTLLMNEILDPQQIR